MAPILPMVTINTKAINEIIFLFISKGTFDIYFDLGITQNKVFAIYFTVLIKTIIFNKMDETLTNPMIERRNEFGFHFDIDLLIKT